MNFLRSLLDLEFEFEYFIKKEIQIMKKVRRKSLIQNTTTN